MNLKSIVQGALAVGTVAVIAVGQLVNMTCYETLTNGFECDNVILGSCPSGPCNAPVACSDFVIRDDMKFFTRANTYGYGDQDYRYFTTKCIVDRYVCIPAYPACPSVCVFSHTDSYQSLSHEGAGEPCIAF